MNAQLRPWLSVCLHAAKPCCWVRVQNHQILGSSAANNTSQPNRPYMRWEELMALYYPSHVIFVDPKVAVNYRAELLTMMDAMPGTPTDHFVAKYYSVSGGASNTSGWNFDAKACGCGTRQANHGPCLPECSGSHHHSFKGRRWNDGVGRQYEHPACYYLALYLREC